MLHIAVNMFPRVILFASLVVSCPYFIAWQIIYFFSVFYPPSNASLATNNHVHMFPQAYPHTPAFMLLSHVSEI